MIKNITVRTFNPEESIPVYKSTKIVRVVNEYDDFPQDIGETNAHYLNGVKHKVFFYLKQIVLIFRIIFQILSDLSFRFRISN